MDEAFYGKSELEELEKLLKKDMFLTGFEVSDRDHEAFKKLPEVNEERYPNVARWARYISHISHKE